MSCIIRVTLLQTGNIYPYPLNISPYCNIITQYCNKITKNTLWLAAISPKALKNNKELLKRVKNSKNIPGLHTDIYPPPVAHTRPCGAKYLFLLTLTTIHNIHCATPGFLRFLPRLSVRNPFLYLRPHPRSVNSTDKLPRWPFWWCFDGAVAYNTAQEKPQPILESAAISWR